MSKYAAAAPIPLAMLKVALQVFVELSASCPLTGDAGEDQGGPP